MTTFQYCAYSAQGELAAGNIEASTSDAASDLLWEQGLTAFQIRPINAVSEKWWQREVFSGRKPSRSVLPAFTRELSTLMTAEIPLDDALRILSDPAASAQISRLAADLRADVLNGAALSDAMGRQSQIFPADYLSMVRAGEIGGTVGDVFSELADLLDRRMEMRARVRAAFTYPALLVCLAVVSLAVIVGTLVPSVASVFAGSGKPLPTFITIALAIQSRWMEILVALALAIGCLTWIGWIVLHNPRSRIAIDTILLRMPTIGSFILEQETARFARTIGTLLRVGVPLLQASLSARGGIRNSCIASQIDKTIDAVRDGAALHRALLQETKLPPLALRMITIGDEAGKLDRMLLRVAAVFEQATQRTIEKSMTLLTPALTMIMAAFVGGLIVAVMDAIMSMNGLAF